MLGAALQDDGAIVMKEFPIPEPQEGEARLRILQTGVCNTDVELTRGYKGFQGIIGHEFVAVVDKIVPDKDKTATVSVGQRVVSEINCVPSGSGCRSYDERAQHPDRAALGIFRANGAFAQYVVVPLVNLHAVPDKLSNDEAMFVEPLAAACQIVQQVHIKSDYEIGVVGTGKLGILICQVLKAVGGKVTAFGRRRETFEPFLKRNIPCILVSEYASNNKFDIVVDCTGNEKGFDTALGLTKPRGTLVLKSTFEGMTSANLTKVVVDEITIVGSRCGPFAMALRLLEEEKVTVDGLITHRYKLEETAQAIAAAASKDSLKVAVKVED